MNLSPIDSKETWKAVVGYERLYEVSDLGNVVRIKRNDNRQLTPRDNVGYYAVALCKDGKGKSFLIHRLVALAFLPMPDQQMVVNHKNGIKTDNRLCNLEWTTQKANIRHAIETLGRVFGTNRPRAEQMSRGESSGRNKLTETQIVQIREMAANGYSQRNIAKTFTVTQACIYDILNRHTWRHV